MMGLALVVAIVAVILLGMWAAEKGTYRRDERNPYRRYCIGCGQQQDRMCYSWDLWRSASAGWWEANGAIRNATCSCHKDCDHER